MAQTPIASLCSDENDGFLKYPAVFKVAYRVSYLSTFSLASIRKWFTDNLPNKTYLISVHTAWWINDRGVGRLHIYFVNPIDAGYFLLGYPDELVCTKLEYMMEGQS